MALDARLAYVEQEILQAGPVKLVQLLYRGAVQAVAAARVHVQARDIAARSRQITKASEILSELTLSLDRQRGGEIAIQLAELYDYMQRRLQDANFRQVEEPLVEVEVLLTTLLEAWEQCDPSLATSVRTEPAPATPPPTAYDDFQHYAPQR